MINAPLRVLMVGEAGRDADAVAAELRRAGFDAVLERAADARAFARALREFAPTVVLVGDPTNGFDARAALDVMRAERPAVPLLLLNGALDEQLAVACLRSGAETIVARRNLARLGAAVRTALDVRSPLEKLSPRQLEVLRLVAEGQTTRQIATRLELSVKTVDTHRGEVMKRLGMHDVVSLVRYAIRVGLVTLEP